MKRLAILDTTTGRKAFNPERLRVADGTSGNQAPYVAIHTDRGERCELNMTFDEAVAEIESALNGEPRQPVEIPYQVDLKTSCESNYVVRDPDNKIVGAAVSIPESVCYEAVLQEAFTHAIRELCALQVCEECSQYADCTYTQKNGQEPPLGAYYMQEASNALRAQSEEELAAGQRTVVGASSTIRTASDAYPKAVSKEDQPGGRTTAPASVVTCNDMYHILKKHPWAESWNKDIYTGDHKRRSQGRSYVVCSWCKEPTYLDKLDETACECAACHADTPSPSTANWLAHVEKSNESGDSRLNYPTI